MRDSNSRGRFLPGPQACISVCHTQLCSSILVGDAIYIIWISIGETSKEDVAMIFEDERCVPSLLVTAYCDKIRENSGGIFEISKNTSST